MQRVAAEPDARRALQTFAADCPQMRALSAVFAPDAQGFRPLTVVLQGRPGVGKSALARRVLLHWARGELYPGAFSFVLLLDFRDLPWRSARTSFAALLSRAWPGAQVPVAAALAQPERLLLVVDGCDDLVVASEDADLDLCDSWTEERLVPHLACSLLRKALLPACSLVVIARDRGLDGLRPMLVSPRYLLAEGLGLERRIQALLGRVRSEARRGQALRAVLDNHVLTDSCQAAVACWLLGRALELQLAARSGPPPARPPSLTGLFLTFVLHQLAPRAGPGRCLGPDERAALRGLCRLAARGLWARQSVFGGGDLARHGLPGPELSGLLGRSGLLLRWERRGEPAFTFPHPSLQAFFAALHYVLEGPAAGGEAQAPSPEHPKSPRGLDAPLLQARRFLFGLVNPEAARALEQLLGCAVVPAVRRALLRWVSLLGQQAGAAAASPLDVLDSFHCLFETQDQEFARLALSGFRDVGLTVTRALDLSVAAFCLRHCRHLRGVRVDIREVFPEEESAETWPVMPQG